MNPIKLANKSKIKVMQEVIDNLNEELLTLQNIRDEYEVFEKKKAIVNEKEIELDDIIFSYKELCKEVKSNKEKYDQLIKDFELMKSDYQKKMDDFMSSYNIERK